MKDTCANCKKYDSDGYCNLVKISSKRRREKPTTWCQWHERREVLVEEDCPESPTDNDDREQRESGDARSLSTYERRVEMGGVEVILRWDDDTQEISVSCYLEGEPYAAIHLAADLCSDRSRRTMPILPTLGGTQNAPQELVDRDSVQSPRY